MALVQPQRAVGEELMQCLNPAFLCHLRAGPQLNDGQVDILTPHGFTERPEQGLLEHHRLEAYATRSPEAIHLEDLINQLVNAPSPTSCINDVPHLLPWTVS